MFARPYICRLSIFSRFTCPSVCPLLHVSVSPTHRGQIGQQSTRESTHFGNVALFCRSNPYAQLLSLPFAYHHRECLRQRVRRSDGGVSCTHLRNVPRLGGTGDRQGGERRALRHPFLEPRSEPAVLRSPRCARLRRAEADSPSAVPGPWTVRPHLVVPGRCVRGEPGSARRPRRGAHECRSAGRA